MNQTANITIIILIIAIAVWGVISFGGSQPADDTNATSADDAAQSAQVPKGWTEYQNESFSFTFKRPQDAEVKAENGQAKVQILGENNEPNTEVTDGITGYISMFEPSQEDLQAATKQLLASKSRTAQEVISGVASSTFASRTGYSFELRNQLGSATNYQVLKGANEGRAYQVSYTVSGADSDTYMDTFETIVSSLENPSSAPEDDSDPKQSATSSDDTNTGSRAESLGRVCEQAGGKWLGVHNECEGVQKNWCTQRDGSYNNCASACRHDPDGDMCTQQCVQVCHLGD